MLATYVVLNTNDSGPDSLRAAIALANADAELDTIEFNLAAGPQTIQLQSTLVINNSVDIVGPGTTNLILDGGNSIRLFQIDESTTEIGVGIRGLTLRNGNAGTTGDGGAISSASADLNIDQVAFINNRGRDGGAIHYVNLDVDSNGFSIGSAFVFISDSEFTGNSATNGGAIYNDKGHFEIENGSIVANNVATTNGGAFYTIGFPEVNLPSTLILRDSSVTGNIATAGSGGAVFADTDRVEFHFSTVANNRAAVDGGAVYAVSLTGSSEDETFRSQSLVAEESSFTGNTAGARGGAIYAMGYQLQLNSMSFVDNRAVSGGAIVVDENPSGFSSLFANSSTFENNAAVGTAGIDGRGGAIYSLSSNTNFGNDSRFINNRAIGGAGATGKGGAIYSENYTFLSWATFTGNSASGGNSEGGAIWSSSPFSQSFQFSTFSNNSAGEGGALFLTNETAVFSSTFAGNRALTGEGGGVWTNSPFQSANSTYHGNSAATNGGGIYIGLVGAVNNLSHLTITDNRADSDGNGSGVGGGLFTDGSEQLTNSIVAGNLVGTGTTRDDIAGTLTSSTGNLVSVATGFTGITNGTSLNQVGTTAAPIDPLLGPLKNNGGKTQTRALLNGSPALDRANPSVSLTTDQRDENFFFDSNFRSQRTGAPDIGAFERVFDFGDARIGYPVTLASNGARHEMASNLYLGRSVDSNVDGLPTEDASGDDTNFLDDENGVAFRFITATFMARADVTASAPGLLSGWIDLNRDGDWTDAGEQILSDKPVIAGVNPVDFSVGSVDFAGANFILTYARFRISTQAGLNSVGLAADGEVEDYRIRIEKVVMPTNPTVPGGPFTFSEEPVIARVRRSYDPLWATGYDYVVQSGPKFATLELPPGYGDNAFTVSFTDGNGDAVNVPFNAAEEVDFEFGTVEGISVFTGVSGGISSFRITGIELSAQVEATSDVAFMTYLSFAADGSATFTQTPISVFVALNDTSTTSENTVVNVGAPGVLANDTYPGASLTVIEVNGLASNLGVVTTLASGATVLLSADGSYIYDPRTAFDYLPLGATATDSFVYKVSDGPRTALATVTINLTGVNDAATIGGARTGSVTEDAASFTVTGTLTIVDVDINEAKFTSGSLAGTYGSFTFNNTTGAWTYALDNSAAVTTALRAGEIVQDTLTVSSHDGTASAIIDVTITGANDAAAITGIATGTLTEDAATTSASGDLDVSDVDSPLAFQAPSAASLAGVYGSFTFDAANGNWSYALNNLDADTNALAAGQVVKDKLTVLSSDGTATQDIEVTITGANDAAAISGTATGALTEDASTTSTSGDLNVSDVDSPLTFQSPAAASLAGVYGNFTFDASTGNWSYALNNLDADTNALAAGQVVRDRLTVLSSDGTATRDIEVVITGANDAATITGTATGTVTEDAAVSTVSGTLSVADVDSPQNFRTPTGLAGVYGNFTFNTTTGAWTYALNNSDPDTNALSAGQVVRDLLTVTSNDGTASRQIDITINGANDGVVNTPPTVTIAGPTAGVRGQELTFTLSANDSAADRAAGFRYTIRWGDGTPDTVINRTANNGTGVTVKRIFATTGSFNISVVATDQANAASAPATRTVAITAVGIQTDPRNPSGTALFIGGTTGNDNIELFRQSGQLRVKVNGITTSYSNPFTNIIVFGQAGNDCIQVASSVTTAAMLFGGDGDDCIKAGNGPTVLVGGAGNDCLYGGLARDIMIGGTGRDTLFGSGDGDILIGSSTTNESNLGILGSIVDEWVSSRTYQTRIANLANRLNTTTVIDDNAADILWGSSGLDWYFAEHKRTTRDKVYSSWGEVVTALL